MDYAYFYLGQSQIKHAQYTEARTIFLRLQRDYPQSLLLPDVTFLIADTHYFQGEYETAIQHYLAIKNDKSYRTHPWLPEIYLKLGQCYEQRKDFASARKIYHQAHWNMERQKKVFSY